MYIFCLDLVPTVFTMVIAVGLEYLYDYISLIGWFLVHMIKEKNGKQPKSVKIFF